MSAIAAKAFSLLLPALLVACAGVTLKDYEPSSPDESAVREMLLTFQDAWNQQAKRTCWLFSMTTSSSGKAVKEGEKFYSQRLDTVFTFATCGEEFGSLI